MPSLSEEFKNRSVQSVRINDGLLDVCKATGLSLSQIVEACLGQFATMNDTQRIETLTEFDPDKLDVTRVQKPQVNLAAQATEKAKRELGTQATNMPGKTLLSIGLLLLGAAGVIAMSNGSKKSE